MLVMGLACVIQQITICFFSITDVSDIPIFSPTPTYLDHVYLIAALLPCTTLYYPALPCNTLYYHVLPYSSLCYLVLPCTTLYYTVLSCSSLYYPVLLFTSPTIPCTTPLYPVLPFTTIYYPGGDECVCDIILLCVWCELRPQDCLDIDILLTWFLGVIA